MKLEYHYLKKTVQKWIGHVTMRYNIISHLMVKDQINKAKVEKLMAIKDAEINWLQEQLARQHTL